MRVESQDVARLERGALKDDEAAELAGGGLRDQPRSRGRLGRVGGCEWGVRTSPAWSAGLLRTTRRPSSGAVGCAISPAAAACWGARIIDSCGSRRSRAAERTIRQMKR